MASDPGTLQHTAQPEGAAYAAPLAGDRRQNLQRLQVGLFGLAAMVLLVGLANIINTNRQQNEAQVVPEAAATAGAVASPSVASDPLADAGMVPDLPEAAPAAPAGADAPQP